MRVVQCGGFEQLSNTSDSKQAQSAHLAFTNTYLRRSRDLLLSLSPLRSLQAHSWAAPHSQGLNMNTTQCPPHAIQCSSWFHVRFTCECLTFPYLLPRRSLLRSREPPRLQARHAAHHL